MVFRIGYSLADGRVMPEADGSSGKRFICRMRLPAAGAEHGRLLEQAIVPDDCKRVRCCSCFGK